MTAIYPVIFTETHDEKNTFLIEIPDLNGFTQGYGLKEAYEMARDYIGAYFLEAENKAIPEASPISEIKAEDGEFKDEGESFVSLVDIDLDAYRVKVDTKPVRRNVSIPNWLNQAANDAHLNVSRILQDALIEKLEMAK